MHDARLALAVLKGYSKLFRKDSWAWNGSSAGIQGETCTLMQLYPDWIHLSITWRLLLPAMGYNPINVPITQNQGSCAPNL